MHGICFVLQFVDLYLHAENEEEDKKRPLYKRIVAYLVHVVVLNLAFFSSVCSFRGYWWILDIYFIFPGMVSKGYLGFHRILTGMISLLIFVSRLRNHQWGLQINGIRGTKFMMLM